MGLKKPAENAARNRGRLTLVIIAGPLLERCKMSFG